ncbi:RNA polymerase ECF family sigma subunit [Edaphobacter aggregans]|uniref:RNA polymerase ECF family sigma subunit n=1 Tax=Edaphobacter aggregans TaxID=570835 RepID=A0A3R9NYG0_9BACT|nr:sigma-70 family RNA polymerase sigma factor [Edaphobacter aggregans]RSL17638.1 RNA polymerase ECF family sigma subunit [Edaphobacter aggregans]
MGQSDALAEQFEESRGHLRGVAYRMLGSLSEADDVVQECWLRLSRSDTDIIENLRGWLTTVVARICLDTLRSRNSRREESLETAAPESALKQGSTPDPETEAVLAESVGYATLVVLDRLNPAERIAFVLHDLFDVPFEEIARITGRTPEAARQLASRARRRVRGATTLPEGELVQQQSLVEKFLLALRLGDATKLLEVLDPDFVVHADAAAAPGVPPNLHGAEAWAKQAIQAARGARLARLAMVEGSVGLLVAPRGRLFRVLRFTFVNGRIAAMEVIGNPERLRTIEVGVMAG